MAPSQDTLTDKAIAALQRDILAGELPPGGRLGVVGLVKRYGIGATPIREALSRLASRDLIIAIGQRGFRVAPLDRDDLADITRIRVVLETEALRRSIEEGGDAWEAAILSSLHQLRRYVARHGSAFGEGTEEFDRLHKTFHSDLIGSGGSARLGQAIVGLYDQAYRYRRIMMKQFTDPDHFIAAHERLAEKVLERQFEPACAELVRHIHSTLKYVYPDTGPS
ncbi:GntR family transcriptional regulator [Phreatobacter sp.]|uniref:GntR family transcriptional regulator n=1 Tax=Phreatobacter sp. TaxID=1966341 RepID=UPI003F707FA9